MRVIYLASPYSHADERIKESRHKQVCLAAARLIAQGAVVFSPVAYSHPIASYSEAPGDWVTWEKQCLALLDRCDLMLVLMLDGWRESTGIRAEALHCIHTQKTIIYADIDSLSRFDFSKPETFAAFIE
jgi:nucleoside 2-deoxyribosyltransferase